MGPNVHVHVLNEGMPSGHVFFRDFVLIIIINNIESINPKIQTTFIEVCCHFKHISLTSLKLYVACIY
jgi:hypothetical protein